VGSKLNSSFDLNDIKGYAVKILDLSDFYISVYEHKNIIRDNAINLIAVRNKKIVKVDDSKKIYKSKKLIPQWTEPFKDRYDLMVFPLSFRKESLGFMVLNLTERSGSTYENMQAIISAALINELQIEELKEAEERFSDIAHSTWDWLWEMDSQNRFTYCSDSVKDIIGYTSEEVIGNNICEYFTAENNSYDLTMRKRENLVNVECMCMHKMGNRVCMLISSKAIIKDGIFVGFRGVFKDITQQKVQDLKIQKLAYYDILTGLQNRTMFQNKLDMMVNLSQISKQKFALMFLDIDRFKYINDSMGHISGDLLLKEVALILKRSVGASGSLYRLGGDEFTIILPNIQKKVEMCTIADKILKELVKPIIINGKQLFVTISIGIAIFPIDGSDSLSILKNADTAMYMAKDNGRNRYTFYDNSTEEKNRSRIYFEEILYSALKNKEFIVQYQPQVDSFTGKPMGVEALVRINSKQYGIIPPNDFIPLAEELGLIEQIDERTFEECCRQYSVWRNKGYENTRIAINLSAIQLRNKRFVKKYIHYMEKYNVTPSDIQLEITENALIENEDMALEILTEFKKYGVKIALDDFGTGHSSLHCIKIYPIDIVKIDRTFVKDSISNSKNISIIGAIVHMAKELNLKIVAEGVETFEQYEMIKSLGCNEIQGYYFCKPCYSKGIEEILHKDFHFRTFM
jgi:diguanylate cyclase (GGDEF)-like protein/PAS domain S-box-containing protein